ncbi:MAG: hypothetical protein AABX37_01550 [Nanoarchaeota archaeon]
MIEQKPVVEALGYIGGQDEDLGGFCEPLVVRVAGEERYVLHEMHTYRDVYDRYIVKAQHKKVEFASLDGLLAEFGNVERRLGIDESLPWVVTDQTCGYAVPKEEFDNARSQRRCHMYPASSPA